MDPVVGFRKPRRSAAQRSAAGSFESRARGEAGDPGERAALIEEFMPLARSPARGFGTNRDSGEDLVQVACAGLVEVALCALFAISGLYHRWRWDRRWRPLLRRLDHSTIYVFIAASWTPLALLLLSGPTRVIVVLGVWCSAAAGVLISVAWISAPRARVAASSSPSAARPPPRCAPPRAPAATPIVLLGLGALLYCASAPASTPSNVPTHSRHIGLPRGLSLPRDPRRGQLLRRRRRVDHPQCGVAAHERPEAGHVSPTVGVGVICALLSALETDLAFLFKHRGALAAPI